MAANLASLRAGLAANLAAIPNVQIQPYMLSNPTPPSIGLHPGGAAGDIIYHRAMRDGVELWPFTVQAVVGDTADIGAQVLLDTFLTATGSSSVKAALEADKTLGGAAQTLNVVSCIGYRSYLFEGRPPLLGAEWHVDVYPA